MFRSRPLVLEEGWRSEDNTPPIPQRPWLPDPDRLRQGLDHRLNGGVCLALLIIFLTIAQAEEGIGHVEPVKVVAEEIGYGFIGGVSAISSVPTR